jgi:type 1 glutamine amidotransferase
MAFTEEEIMNREGKTLRARAATAFAAAWVLLGGVSISALADNDRDRDRDRHGVDTRSGTYPDLNDPDISGDFDYGVCRGTDPRCYHDWAHEERSPEPKVLIYTRTAGPRHANLGPRLAAGLNPPLTPANVVQNALIRWLAAEGIGADWTEDVSWMNSPGRLHPYRAVIFASTSRDTLTDHGKQVNPTAAVSTSPSPSAHIDAAKTALRQYIRAGGGFVGIHNAFGTEYNWPYYEGLLGNANYYDHGANQNGDAVVVAGDSSTQGLPPRWPFRDEWYNLRPFPTKVKFLLTVDETTLATRREIHPGHGKFHPVAWCQYYDGGRVWVTTLGHDAQAFTEGSSFPGQAQFQKLVTNGIKSAMGLLPFCVTHGGHHYGRD